jgi:SAM-dependent methyltransferase
MRWSSSLFLPPDRFFLPDKGIISAEAFSKHRFPKSVARIAASGTFLTADIGTIATFVLISGKFTFWGLFAEGMPPQFFSIFQSGRPFAGMDIQQAYIKNIYGQTKRRPRFFPEEAVSINEAMGSGNPLKDPGGLATRDDLPQDKAPGTVPVAGEGAGPPVDTIGKVDPIGKPESGSPKPMAAADGKRCPVCGSLSSPVCTRTGTVPPVRDYAIFHCPDCFFSFIPDYRTDYEVIYSDAYYRGEGADPMVHYLFDHEEPEKTLRRREWEGLTEIYRFLAGNSAPQARWLDYGCGLGSLVRFGREKGIPVFGYEPFGKLPENTVPTALRDAPGTGTVAENAPEAQEDWKRYLLDREGLEKEGPFDFITAIEVIEHDPSPLSFLGNIRPLLKDGGILFLTTGNARPFRGKLSSWSYTSVPDVHMSFFEPGSLALAMEKSGFQAKYRGFIPGFSKVISYKVLKNLGFREDSFWFKFVPWFLVSRLADLLYKVTGHPIGVASKS